MSPGHSLVMPRRHVATYFDATADEQADLWRGIADLKVALDRELHPDGYNVGFNAGDAAGQTVPHLHVHLIPRFHGDMADPRGGVRGVIPEKQRYEVAPTGTAARTTGLHDSGPDDGELAAALAHEFQRRCPATWTCAREARILDERLADRYGFQPRADVVFTGAGGRRIVVELEISRADPVANQVKFLIARNAGALRPDDVLVSMFSSHIARGRRNVAAAFARHLRTEGTAAFQVSLLPDVAPAAIKDANADEAASRDAARSGARRELDRIWSIHDPLGEREHRIHFAGDVADVVANIWTWNDEAQGIGSRLWAHRAIQFFAYDPVSRLFAPSKFCAFVPVARIGVPSRRPP